MENSLDLWEDTVMERVSSQPQVVWHLAHSESSMLRTHRIIESKSLLNNKFHGERDESSLFDQVDSLRIAHCPAK